MSTNEDWKAWGRLDPLYGVASVPGRSRAAVSRWTDADFLALGVHDWRVFLPHWEQYGLETEACVELGCGAGRMTAQLARCFASVDAVDVSPEMLEAARRNVTSPHVRFHVTDGIGLPLEGSSVTAAFSVHVFQHLDSRASAFGCFRELHRVLRPNGSLMIHLPIVVWPHGRFHDTHAMLERGFEAGRALLLRARRVAYRRRLVGTPAMAMLSYEVDWLEAALRRVGFADLEIRLVFTESQMAQRHPFVFARKP